MKMALLITLAVSTTSAVAGERYDFYKGVRQMGMGGASVATANDETALISNPAGLGKLRDYYITIIDPELEMGADTYTVAGLDSHRVTDPQFALDKCNANPDKHLHVRAQLFPSIVVPNFGVGLFWRNSVDAQVNTSPSAFDYNYINDYALVMGVNFRFWDGIIKIGTNARIVNRTEVHNDAIPVASTDLSLSTLASSGVGVGSDSGIILTAPVAWLPAIAAVYRDTGSTSYGLRDGLFMSTASRPQTTPATVDAGFSIQPILGKRVRSTWTVEYRDAMNAYEENDTMRRVHGGVELNFADAFFLRGGWNQRYWTAGLELSMFNYQFQVATYGEDIGPVGTPTEDRRYDVKFSFRF